MNRTIKTNTISNNMLKYNPRLLEEIKLKMADILGIEIEKDENSEGKEENNERN